MQLTKQTDYSLRILMYLGLKKNGLTTIEEVCRAYDLSIGHTMKLVNELSKAGYISTIRGRGGGFRLAVCPSEINIGDVFRSTEKNLSLVECFQSDSNRCPLSDMCILSNIFHRALGSFLAVLDDYTLQDLLRPQ
ncbi:MAG: RrF2 family transcriptional regulator, partial [Hyphomicrobiaceae bacterium]